MCTSGGPHRPLRSAGRRASHLRSALAIIDDILRIFPIEEDPLPDLEVHQCPEALAVVLAGLVTGDEPSEHACIEQSARPGSLAEYILIEKPPMGAAQPLAERHGKSHLPPLKNCPWQDIAHRLPEHILRRPAAQLHVIGK